MKAIVFIICGVISTFSVAQQTEPLTRPSGTPKQERMVGENAPQPTALNQTEMRTEYAYRIQAKIKRFIVLPPNLQGNPEVEFQIKLLPDGNVVGTIVRSPSGNTAFDNAVERAISRATPLPLPPDPAMAKDFREIVLKFKAQG